MTLLLLLACSDKDPGDTQDSGPVTNPSDTFCQAEELIGEVLVQRWGTEGQLSLTARVYDAPNPWIGAPTERSSDCAYYRYDAAACGECGAEQVCGVDGSCADSPRTDKEASLTITSEAGSQTFDADDIGLMWGEVQGQTMSFDLQWSGGHIQTAELSLLDGLVAQVSAEGDYDAPGALSITWSGSEEGHVGTVIPINHHAGAPTFTSCQAPASQGSIDVPAAMVDPLSVITGLEFQGVFHGSYAAARTDAGCIQFAVRTQHYTDVGF